MRTKRQPAMSSQKTEPAAPSAEAASTSSGATLPVVPKSQTASELLRVDSSIVPGEVFVQLLKLEKRQLPETIPATMKDPSTNPRSACFGTSRPSAWCAHRMCQRCELLNQVMSAAAQNASSASYSALLTLTLLSTDCISETTDCYGEPLKAIGDENSQRMTLTLPAEMWQRVLEYVVSGAVSGRDIVRGCAPTLRTLMHTSFIARLKVIELFTPLSLYELEAPTKRTLKAPVHSVLVMFLMQCLQYFILDPTLRRHQNSTKPSIPESSVLVRSTGGDARTVSFTVIVETQTPSEQSSSRPNQVDRHEAKVTATDPSRITVKDACVALDMAFSNAGAAPRFASAFVRSKRSSRLEAIMKSQVTVTMSFDSTSSRTLETVRLWKFSPSSQASQAL